MNPRYYPVYGKEYDQAKSQVEIRKALIETYKDLTSIQNSIVAAEQSLAISYNGLELSYVNTTTIGIQAGWINSDDWADVIISDSAFTKTTGSWQVGSGNGGLDMGTVANNTWYAVFIIKNQLTGVADYIMSTSGTSPLLQPNYTKKKRIGWIRTNGAAQVISFYQEGFDFFWSSKTQELNAVNPASTNRILLTVACPINTIGKFSFFVFNTAGTVVRLDVGYTGLADNAASDTNFIMIAYSGATTSASGYFPTLVDGSNQIYYRVSATVGTVIYNTTIGWTDKII